LTAPLIVFALDSADPELLLRWATDGSLPALGSLLARGAHARLAGPEMLSAHGVWCSLWSGLSLSIHGRYLQRPLRSGSYDLQGLDEALLAAPPFWTSLRERRIVVLDAPDARPVPGLDGLQLLRWGTHSSTAPPVSEPAGLATDLQQRFGPPIRSDETQGTRFGDRRAYRRILERVARQGALARHLLQDGFHLAVVGFGDAHAAGHRFWRYGPDASISTQDAELSGALRQVYCAIDAELGRILATLPRDAQVVVLSDHGIREGYPTWEITSAFCHRLGYQVAHGSQAFAEAGRSLRGVWPRVRARFLPGTDDAAARTLEKTDWARTTVFAIPSDYRSLLRVNLRGRERLGRVEPTDYDALLDRIEADLLQVVDAESGAPAVERITRSAEAFGGGPPHRLPDMFVDWRLNAARPLAHPLARLRARRLGLPRATLHSRTGLVLAAGPTIGARGDLGEMSPIEITPLLRSLLGEAPAREGSSTRALDAFARGRVPRPQR